MINNICNTVVALILLVGVVFSTIFFAGMFGALAGVLACVVTVGSILKVATYLYGAGY